jgi:malonyl CoA-acyl carrier protein transacylase
MKSIGVNILIELLAYQFASPVRWIETQDYLFRNNVDRVVELGPASTLVDMAKRYSLNF